MPNKKTKKKKKKKYNIILDIDETLCTSVFNLSDNKLKTFNVSNIVNLSISAKKKDSLIFNRPYLLFFLNYLVNNYNVSIWSAGTKKQAMGILDSLPEKIKNAFKFIMVRHKLDTHKITYVNLKNNKKYTFPNLKTRPLKPMDFLFEHKDFKNTYKKDNTLLIDDNSYHKSISPDNVILIPEYTYNSPNDIVLLKLVKWFKKNMSKNSNKDITKLTKPKFYNYKKKPEEEIDITFKKKKNLEIGDTIINEERWELIDDEYIIRQVYNINKDTIEFYNLTTNKYETFNKYMNIMKKYNKYYEVLTHSY